MTVLDDVAQYFRKAAPDPIRDDGIAKGLGLSVRQHANRNTRELALRPGFDRRRGPCRECHDTKLVIRWRT
jgi:hypothetical protein